MVATLPPTRAQSRYGVGFLRTLCAQAGYGLIETSADEDVLAVDCIIDAPATPIRVQVKCTTRAFDKKEQIGFQVKENWRQAWAQSLNDIYFVVVRLSTRRQEHWVTHPDLHTEHRAIAYWTRIEPQNIPKRVMVSKTRRLTHATIADWDSDLLAKHGALRCR